MNMLTRLLSGLCGLLLAAILAMPFGGLTGPAAADDQNMSLGGREFILYSPSGIGDRAVPLLLMLHGGLDNAEGFRSKIRMESAADQFGFRVAYLNGTIQGRERGNRRTWNSGECCGSAEKSGVDDVGFIASVISGLEQRGIVDSNRVFLAGQSNGAMMAYFFACSRPNMIRGIVAMSGTLTSGSCSNASGVKVLHIHGSADTTVPVAGGGRGERLNGEGWIPLQETLDRVRAAGASVDLLMLEGASHRVSSLDPTAVSQTGKNLAQIIGEFVANN